MHCTIFYRGDYIAGLMINSSGKIHARQQQQQYTIRNEIITKNVIQTKTYTHSHNARAEEQTQTQERSSRRRVEQQIETKNALCLTDCYYFCWCCCWLCAPFVSISQENNNNTNKKQNMQEGGEQVSRRTHRQIKRKRREEQGKRAQAHTLAYMHIMCMHTCKR